MQAEIRTWFSKTSKFNVHLPKCASASGDFVPQTLYPGSAHWGLTSQTCGVKNSLNYALSKTPSPIHVIYLHSKAQCS